MDTGKPEWWHWGSQSPDIMPPKCLLGWYKWRTRLVGWGRNAAHGSGSTLGWEWLALLFGRQKAELLSSKRSPGLCLYFIQAPKPISVCASVASGIQPSVFTQVKPTAVKMSVSQWNWYSPLCSLSGECFSYCAENSSLWIAYRELNKTICVPELLVSFFSCPFFFKEVASAVLLWGIKGIPMVNWEHLLLLREG